MQTSPLKQQQQRENTNTTTCNISSLLSLAAAANNTNLNGIKLVAFLQIHALLPYYKLQISIINSIACKINNYLKKKLIKNSRNFTLTAYLK